MEFRTIYYFSALVCLAACSSNNERQQQDAVRVLTEVVSENDYSYNRNYVGEVEAQASTAVGFTGSGTIQKVLVRNGEHVHKGQLIAVMDPTLCRNSVMAAKAITTQAQDAYDRMKILHDKRSLSDMDWVEVQTKLTQAKSSLQIAEKMLEDCNLKAPCSGVIGKKMMESGQVALPSQPVCTLLDIDNVKIKLSIPEKEIGTITDGSESRINIAALNKTFAGGKIEKEIEADAMTRTYVIRINVGNKDGLILPGMVCDVTLRGSMKSDSSNQIFIPITTVQKSATGDMFVWKVTIGKASRCKVEVGDTKGDNIAIKSGLRAGEKIIMKGYHKLSEGTPIVESVNNKR